jgi:hypothetical protein
MDVDSRVVMLVCLSRAVRGLGRSGDAIGTASQ